MWCKIFVYYADIVIFVLERFNLARLVCSASASRSPDSFPSVPQTLTTPMMETDGVI